MSVRDSHRVALAAGFMLVSSFALSFVHPWGNPRGERRPEGTVLAGAQNADPVREVIAAKCANCHSVEVEWPIYSRLAPASWLIERDVIEARSQWNFSRWSAYTADQQMSLLSQLGLRARTGSMPPPRYTSLHPASKLTSMEQSLIYEWTRSERRRLHTAAPVMETTHENTK